MAPESASRSALGFMRIWIFGTWLFKVVADPLQLLAALPVSAFDPPGVLRILPEPLRELLLRPGGLIALQFILALALIHVILGLRFTRPVAVAACVLLVAYQGLVRGFSGHMDHEEFPLLHAAMALALSPCADGLALGPAPARPRSAAAYQAPLLAIMAAVCMTYCFVGVNRLIHGGLAVFTSGSMRHWVVKYSLMDTYYPWSIGELAARSAWAGWILNASFLAVTILEVLSPLALVSASFRRAWLVSMLAFHLSMPFVLKMFFWENCVVLLVFLDLKRWFPEKLDARQPLEAEPVESGGACEAVP